MSKDLICPKCNTEYWGLATGKNGAKCSNCSYEFAVADVKAVLLPNEDLICILCKEEEVEVEDGEKSSSYCNPCFFHVLILRNGEMYILEDDVKAFGYTYQTVPAQILNPFDSYWQDEANEYYEEMEEERKLLPHLEKWKDMPQELWIEETTNE